MNTATEAPAEIDIDVVYALPEVQQLLRLRVANGTCARDALHQVLKRKLLVLTDTDAQQVPIGVYGQLVDDKYVLKAGDRLEIYRPLLQDPKERRRQQASLASRRSD